MYLNDVEDTEDDNNDDDEEDDDDLNLSESGAFRNF